MLLRYARLVVCLSAVFLAGAAMGAVVPAGFGDLSRKYLQSGSEADREALRRAVVGAAESVRPLARLALGVGDHAAERYDDAAGELARARGTPFDDHAVFFEGRSLAKAEQFEQAASVFVSFSANFPKSRFARQASQILAESLIGAERFEQAKRLLKDEQTPLSAPVRRYLFGRVLQLTGNELAAVASYRRAYYFYPFSESADDAEKRLDALRKRLGSTYPEAPAKWRLARADALFSGRDYDRAAAEYRRAWPGLSGVEQQRAKVRYAAAEYRRLHTTTAYQFLKTLKPSDPALAAERLYYLGECARRKRLVKEFQACAAELGREYPRSPWREEALFSLGNYFLLENDARRSREYYEKAAREFPKGKYASLCHWKVCWRAYLDRDPRARSLLEEHVRLYPGSAQASAALYWIGRVDEKADLAPAAKGLYQEIVEHFPNYYYALLARDRLAELSKVQGSPPPQELHHRLPRPRRIDRNPRPSTVRLIERGRALFDIGLDDLAARELATGDYRLSDAPLIGLELARESARRGRDFEGLRQMKRYGFGYLRMQPDSMPREFWERLYPIPFESRLRARAAPHGLDPYLIAGLIRQESEYNPKAVSRAGAMGLMQLMPATGREIFRRLGLHGFSTRRLHDPDVSMRLGTFHLKQVLKDFGGQLEIALAAYNAGENRAREWLTWGRFDEPAEFIETIPFTETRGYVQSVLRNREMYRRLYGDRERIASAENPAAGR